MKAKLFAELQQSVQEAVDYRRGKKSSLRVTRFMPAAKPLKPSDIRQIRRTLGVSQRDFARYLGTPLGTVRSWEQGVRKPRSAAHRLLSIAKRNPAVLLQRS